MGEVPSEGQLPLVAPRHPGASTAILDGLSRSHALRLATLEYQETIANSAETDGSL